MKGRMSILLIAIAMMAASAAWADGGFLDVEMGAAFTGYNDVRIPSETGDMISLATDTDSDPAVALRVRGGYTFGDRHTVLALVAPLTVRGSGTLDRDVTYQSTTFLNGTEVQSVYRFDSYRLTYRYAFVKTDALELAAGLTAKLRSADIALMSATAYAHRSDLGAVPLISFRAAWRMAGPWSVSIDGDALVTPFGRAEDALAALEYSPADSVSYRLGYRVLEGGSDGGGSVYTFALFNYVTAGITVRF